MKQNILKRLLGLAICFLSLNHLQAQKYPEMIKVEGGEFRMGDSQLVGFSDEIPPHTVFVDGFSIGKTEVTVLQWKTYCEETSKEMPKAPEWGWADDQPIVNVSWDEAVAYCNWLSSKLGKKYRLPTEAEWEYAAQGGKLSKGYKYSGGQWMDSLGWFVTNSDKKTHPVAQKRPNELGLFDMSGNALEWTQDWGLRKYTSESLRNPSGKENGTEKAVKGGAYNYAATVCRVPYRLSWEPETKRVSLGLRVVCTD